MLFGPIPTGDLISSKLGWLSLGVVVFSIFTLRSNQAAWPVTGSEFAQRMPSSFGGSNSWIRWFSRKPFFASGASGSSCQAPLRLPMAFQVQMVRSLTPAITDTGTRMRPWCDVTQIQSPSDRSCSLASASETNIGLWP